MIVKDLGLVDYLHTWRAMKSFTINRDRFAEDELWLVEHHPVFTLGINGKQEHILNKGTIPIIHSDRGGQVTYHGPGQLIVYTLFDLRRHKMGVRDMISRLENSVMMLLKELNISSHRIKNAPGVYVDGRKISALGLRIKNGACYHGVSINVAMDLTPFKTINPCGYSGLEVIDLEGIGCDIAMSQAKQQFIRAFEEQMQQG